MKIFFTTLLCALAINSTASARLGETEKECVTRYGPIIKIEDQDRKFPQYSFEKDDIDICVSFLNDRVARIIYTSKTLNDELLQVLLDANSQGSTWKYDRSETEREKDKKSAFKSRQQIYTRSDSKARAAFFFMKELDLYNLAIMTKEFERALVDDKGF